MPTRVVGYVRVSTEEQAREGISLDTQRAKLSLYCELHDLELVNTEADEGLSAKTLNRPGLQCALAALREGRADAVLITKLDRLTRNVWNLGELIERYFEAERWALLSVGDAIDTRSASGRLMLNVLMSVAQWEREAAAERTRDTIAHARSEGARVGRPGLGWRYGTGTDARGRRLVEPVADEAATLERIRALRAAGLSCEKIAARLTAEGRPTKRGGRWADETVRRVLARAARATA